MDMEPKRQMRPIEERLDNAQSMIGFGEIYIGRVRHACQVELGCDPYSDVIAELEDALRDLRYVQECLSRTKAFIAQIEAVTPIGEIE
jgi:hypothetical protein